MNKDFIYTIGIKAKFIPFYKKYKVLKHRTEAMDGTTRLALHCDDGSLIGIPDMAKKQMKVYPDYNTAIKAQESFVATQGDGQNADRV